MRSETATGKGPPVQTQLELKREILQPYDSLQPRTAKSTIQFFVSTTAIFHACARLWLIERDVDGLGAAAEPQLFPNSTSNGPECIPTDTTSDAWPMLHDWCAGSSVTVQVASNFAGRVRIHEPAWVMMGLHQQMQVESCHWMFGEQEPLTRGREGGRGVQFAGQRLGFVP